MLALAFSSGSGGFKIILFENLSKASVFADASG